MATASLGRRLATKGSIIELHFENQNGRVKVVGDDSEIMLLPMEDAISACRAHKDQLRFGNQFRELLDELAQWVSTRTSNVQAAYLTVRDAGLLFVVVRTRREYDETLEDELTDLDLRVANSQKFDLIRLDVQPLPACTDVAIKSFLAAGRTFGLKING